MSRYVNIYGDVIERTAHAGGVGSEQVQDWESAVAYLLRGRDDTDRPLANNTRLIAKRHCLRDRCMGIRVRYADENRACINVKLHQTEIITYHFDGAITLNNGGWDTPTTKQRMNAFTPVWLCVGSERRYIPMAERMEEARKDLAGLTPDEDDIKKWARELLKHESYWVVARRTGFIPWDQRPEDDPHHQWEWEDVQRFHDGIELRSPHAEDLARLPGRSLVPDPSYRSKLGGTARLVAGL